jgi:hypothetical protein
MENVILSPIPLDTLKSEMRQLFRQEFAVQSKADLQEKFLSPQETANLFHPKISKVTLWKWTKDGHISSHRIGGRVFYKYSEVMESVQTLKKYRRA